MSNNTCLTHFETFKIKLTHHLSNFQLVTLVTYIYFIFTVIGRQKIHGYGPGNGPIHEFMRSGRIPLEMDLYFPLFTILQLFFYMGLLKVRTTNWFDFNVSRVYFVGFCIRWKHYSVVLVTERCLLYHRSQTYFICLIIFFIWWRAINIIYFQALFYLWT